MKFLIIFALALATVLTKDLNSRAIQVPVFQNEGRITNGQDATLGQFKYQVALRLEKVNNFIALCGGSLINKNWVLTAAHCVDSTLSVDVYLGATDLDDPEKIVSASKSDIFIHPQWDEETDKNDIALIKIPTISKSSRIGFVKIPSNNKNKYIGHSVIASGWGHTDDNGTQTFDLKYGEMKVLPGSVCVAVYPPSLFIDATNICVATPDLVSTCDGDSGGPLVLKGKNLQIGVTSFVIGAKSCAKGYPAGFTRVSAYLSWIHSHIRKL